eukprot:10070657-Karenia_brevis.AAC.1
MDLARSAALIQARQSIEIQAENQWRVIEVTVPDGFVDPWQERLGDYDPEDECFKYMCGDDVIPSFDESDL